MHVGRGAHHWFYKMTTEPLPSTLHVFDARHPSPCHDDHVDKDENGPTTDGGLKGIRDGQVGSGPRASVQKKKKKCSTRQGSPCGHRTTGRCFAHLLLARLGCGSFVLGGQRMWATFCGCQASPRVVAALRPREIYARDKKAGWEGPAAGGRLGERNRRVS